MAQPCQDEALNDLHTNFHLRLILGFANPCRDDSHTIMGCHLLVGRVQGRFIAAGSGDPTFEVIGNDTGGDGVEIAKSPDMGADPVGQGLTPGGLGIGVITGAQHGHKHLSVPNLTGSSVHDGERLAAVVNKQLIAGPVLLAHGKIQLATPLPEQFAELAVLVAGWLPLLVLLP